MLWQRLALAALLICCCCPGGCRLAAAQPSVESALRELFNGGRLGGMAVSGGVRMETGTDLSVEVTTLVENNGFGLETSFSVSDGRCDFREVSLAAKATITLPDSIANWLKLLNVPTAITVADERRTVSFLPANATDVVDAEFRIGDWADANTRGFLEAVGADATFTVRNARFRTTGMSFQLFMTASVLDPSATLCQGGYKTVAQLLSKTLCTDAGGIEIAETNLGLELRKWLSAAGQNVEYISAADGTIAVGDFAAGSVCSLAPVKFEIKGKLDPGDSNLACLSDATKCTDAARQAMIDGINAQLPDGYKIDASQFANVDVAFDPNTGDVTVGGELFAGAGKDPAALVEALKRYVEKSGGLDINGQQIKNVEVDDKDALAKCKISNGVDAAVCNPVVAPGSAMIPGTKGFGPLSPSAGGGDGEAADMARDNDARRGDQTMLVLGAVLITLAVVAAIGGAVMAIKMFNKRRSTVSAGNFRTFNDDGFKTSGTATPADAFDQVMIEPRSQQQQQQQQPVWGDVVKSRNNTDPTDYA